MNSPCSFIKKLFSKCSTAADMDPLQEAALPVDVNDNLEGNQNEKSPSEQKIMEPFNELDYIYNMNHARRGYALIFNHETFDNPNNQQAKRTGSRVDCDNLIDVLEDLKFEVKDYLDLDLIEIRHVLKKFSSLDHTDADCILIAIMSHGEAGRIHARDTTYSFDKIWSYFTDESCPSLVGKPRLFFVQACQGNKFDAGITLEAHGVESDGPGMENSHSITMCPDFMVAFSTIPGFYSWRNTTHGSWFIQAVCYELKEHGRKYDLLTLMTFVCRLVATDWESNVPGSPDMHKQKQIPCTSTTMTRLLYFKD